MQIKSIIVSVLFIGILIILMAPFAAYFLSPFDAEAKSQMFVIEKGWGVKEIAQALKSAHFIKSPVAFLVYSGISGSAHRLKAGSYELSQSMSLPKIVSVLRNGSKEDITIVVRQGETMAEIDKKLASLQILNKKEPLSKFPGKSLEGFLFPDTYRFFPNSSRNDIVKKFLTNFNKKAMPILSEYQAESIKYKALSYYDALIVASIIEKEVPFLEDRYLVAGILYKRLEISMPLQVDAYPWTYDHYGLPSKPISNPGVDAIRAAVYPKKSDYLYYLSDPVTKKTIFSKTFEEHKENKWKYLRK